MPSSPLPAPSSTAHFLIDRAHMIRRRIAVIGAGAAGLAAALELRREGHGVVVFERAGRLGGTWVYSPAIDSDPLGTNPKREVVHSSLYESLRTNLPRECMGFFSYPFAAVADASERDSRRFPGHREVLRYLEEFATDFDLHRLVRLRTEVLRVEMEEDGGWALWTRRIGGGGAADEREIYDGVVVCNGHFTEPRVAEIPGIEAWPGEQIHSHNYRIPDPFHDKVVVIIGSSASAVDISRDIVGYAKEVHIASRSECAGAPMKEPGYDNLWLHSMIERVLSDGTVLFEDGSSAQVDVIIHCTGYKYTFPFLKTSGIVNVDDNRVGPLYKHVFPPQTAPFLSFIGLPWKVTLFPLFELQSKWVAGVLSGRISLPTPEEMMEDIKNFYSEMEQSGWPKRYTHNLANCRCKHMDWLASQCGFPPVEEWRHQMYDVSQKNRFLHPESFRDEWDDDDLVNQAHQDFKKLLISR
ncbi:Flavin-containing monooxygenase FMO GS-OX-like 3 [Apostasia shenzhenica]|uniref:Flavin-containing monooxygenase n=1 Tax=Apostasia shenzhenica TaxID=1088818 RepID=A0A2H9ZT74_9ASPA|nr:Flavin-containing monooxygenase FMO GS-OX-like 3 [Apostasia shenzhenica]